jgi:hypothetical protein
MVVLHDRFVPFLVQLIDVSFCSLVSELFVGDVNQTASRETVRATDSSAEEMQMSIPCFYCQCGGC